ncbi:MAG: hypothetical protein ACYDC1_14220 [Limisphaerales bacterium]
MKPVNTIRSVEFSELNTAPGAGRRNVGPAVADAGNQWPASGHRRPGRTRLEFSKESMEHVDGDTGFAIEVRVREDLIGGAMPKEVSASEGSGLVEPALTSEPGDNPGGRSAEGRLGWWEALLARPYFIREDLRANLFSGAFLEESDRGA